jgi:hypothetical protein
MTALSLEDCLSLASGSTTRWKEREYVRRRPVLRALWALGAVVVILYFSPDTHVLRPLSHCRLSPRDPNANTYVGTSR